ncbi:mucin-16-like [Heptranchias perlo]|uniref:mucin-16-like n=1 Tax=Heptranchias perlo TaxID=212740 RepID=UPI0035599619
MSTIPTTTGSSTQATTTELSRIETTTISSTTSASIKASTPSTQTSIAAPTSTSAPGSTSTIPSSADSSSQATTTGLTTISTTPLSSTTITSTEASNTSTQTSIAALTSILAPASTSTTAPTTTESTSETSAIESTAISTTPITSTSASTETSTASTQTSTAAPTTTSAPASTSTIPSTTDMSPQATTTKLTTISTTPVSSTSATTETSTTSTQTSTAAPISASAPASTSTIVPTTSETSTIESTTISTTPLTSTGATTEASTAITQASTAAPTSTSALASTSTIPSTTGSSTQATTTELTTISTTPVSSTTSATIEATSASTQTPTVASTSTSAPASTSTTVPTTTEITSQTVTTESTAISTTPLTSTSATAEESTASSQTSTAAPTSVSAPASTNATVPTTRESSSQTLTIESAAISTTPLTSTSASTETSTASTQTSTAAPTSTLAPTSTGTTIPTNSESSTQASTTESTTISIAPVTSITRATSATSVPAAAEIFSTTAETATSLTITQTSSANVGSARTTVFTSARTSGETSTAQTSARPATTESSSSLTPSATETPSTSIQTSTTVPETTSAVLVISSEASTTQTTSMMTVEPPIVPVTDKPVQETQTKNFNVTFNVLTLPFTPSLQNLSSPLYTAESSNILDKLNNLYNNSKVNSTFSNCRSVSFRPASDGNSTIEAICTFIKSATAQQVDKVPLYHEFQDNTKNITTLGTYLLDSNSLFIDGYHESAALTTTPPIVTTTQTPSLEVKPIEFNVTFVITNLAFTKSLQDSTSSLYNSATNIISHQLTDLYNKSKINATFSSCKAVSFSLANVGNTSVYAICTFRNDSTAQEVDKVTVYHEFRDNTKNISTLGTYSLDSNSLYVDGYHELTPSPTISPIVTTTPNIEIRPFDFNVTFIITNLVLTASLQDSTSALYKSASNVIAYQLNELFTNSNINRTFSSCRVLSFSPAKIESTSVYAVCTFRNNSAAQEVDKVTVYHEFRDNTKGISTLGTYSLDNDSLYVNGYHESAPSSTISPILSTTPNLQAKPFDFNVTFIITNLALTASLQDSSSALYKSASNIIAFQLNKLFTNSNINRTFSSCRVGNFSPANNDNTSVYAICTFRNDSAPQEVNKVTVYHEFRDHTKNISTFGTYSLDNDSLYVNGYHESAPSTTISPIVSTTPNLQTKPFDFNVTFIITNLALTASLQDSSSALHKSASNIIAFQLNKLFTNSNINRTFSSCRVGNFSPANVGSTSVYTICTFRNDSSTQEVNKITVCHQFRDNTKDISTIGTYSLDNNSLYINGYHESAPLPTISSIVTTTPNLQAKPFDFNVTFIITNLALTASLQDSSSALHKSASNIIAYQLNRLFTNSNITRTFSSCRVLSFSPANIDDTSVYTVCTFRNDSAPQEVNKVTVYHEFRDHTKSISTFGTYSLDNNSLYVNGYHESAPSPTEAPIVVVTLQPNEGRRPIDFNVTFTINNLTFTSDLQNINSSEYTSTSSNVINVLNNLYRKSKIKKTFSNCKLVSFSPANRGNTKVETLCSFKNDLTVPGVDKVTAYNEFRENTKKITALGAYSLNKNSLFVNGYQELEPTTTPTISIPALREGDLSFELNFTIINRNFTEELNDPNSPEYQSIVANVTKMLAGLFKNSSLKDSFRICKVTGLRIGSVKSICTCYFNPNAANEPVTVQKVRTEFSTGTNGTNLLGKIYQLRNNSLAVEAKAPITTDKIEIPYWGIILIVLGILLILFLLFLLCLLIAFCLKKKYHRSYSVMQNPAGIYFPHQKYH